MKRVSLLPVSEPCVECGAGADEKCASWCLARVLDEDENQDDAFSDEEADSIGGVAVTGIAVDDVAVVDAKSEEASSTR